MNRSKHGFLSSCLTCYDKAFFLCFLYPCDREMADSVGWGGRVPRPHKIADRTVLPERWSMSDDECDL